MPSLESIRLVTASIEAEVSRLYVRYNLKLKRGCGQPAGTVVKLHVKEVWHCASLLLQLTPPPHASVKGHICMWIKCMLRGLWMQLIRIARAQLHHCMHDMSTLAFAIQSFDATELHDQSACNEQQTV